MGALPKNKITRAERGKRRAGNTPTLTKDANTARTPLYKRALVASMLTSMGFSNEKVSREIHKSSSRLSQRLSRLLPGSGVADVTASSAPTAVHRAQHKG